MNAILQLLAIIEAARTWPIPQEARRRRELVKWAALLESNEPMIRLLLGWPDDRPLVIDNLAEKIAQAFGDMLYSQPPRFTAADDQDADALAAMTTGWTGGLQRAVARACGEGEVWWRLGVPDGALHPIPTWHSRRDVVPLMFGDRPQAAAFVSRLNDPTRSSQEVFRHIEVHGVGYIVNRLYRGRHDALGSEVPLTRRPETALLRDVWATGLPFMLADVVRPRDGVSIYRGTWRRLVGLSEAVTIGHENMRLTAKKRIILPLSAKPAQRPALAPGMLGRGIMDPDRPAVLPPYATPPAGYNAGEDVIYEDPLEAEDGGTNRPQVLEYSFDSGALIDWIKAEILWACQRSDVVPQWIGEGDQGQAESGTALRVRLLPTTNAAHGVAVPFDIALPEMARRAQMLEATSIVDGGLGAEVWRVPAEPPAVEREDPLPIDEAEQTQTHATAVTAGILSVETSLRERFPDRDDTWIADEVGRIRADRASTLPSATFGP